MRNIVRKVAGFVRRKQRHFDPQHLTAIADPWGIDAKRREYENAVLISAGTNRAARRARGERGTLGRGAMAIPRSRR